ncbi:uncharacterized protein HMPREF1541_05705 [Cyphellophora europaea CBS 101466]|uniref:Uncharacterized protein n=1 Tax=Cyphellophora europaea (strain CBS 101466) TaxID=1220924 RepID=W2RSJ8_CYPE1|nr:uncharacterized protein HMPREF1541_05705 [Cyphellophora europaea CBS 101466]ETN39481.1 hypothetical protein HMPREF1541_05705 [Cyphellophora europaea CBS 101466]
MHMDAVKAHIGGISGTTGGVTKTSDHDQSMQRVFYDLKGFSCTRAKLPTSSLDIADSIYQGIAMRNAELLPLTGVNARKRSWSAADVCAAYREYFLLFDPTDAQEETVAAAIAFIMQGTIKMLPTRYTGQSSVLWSAQQLLCDVALSLLPKEIEPDVVTGIPKEKVLTCALEYIVGQCGLLLDTKSLRRADKRVLHETLGVTLNAVIRFANVRKVVEKARILLMHVEKGEPLLERS